MNNNNDLLIVEMSSSALSVTPSDNKDYILEGVFGQIDQKNKNNRIYTESEYVPQIEALQQKIGASKLLGELDHPAQFDISLKNVSHIIEELTYDKDSKEVRGRIKLLDTDAGRQAKALVDAGVPLQISSRAAGAVESNGQVKIKQLFTYDLVADPGFENAELKRVNESYGFSNDTGLYIYEVGEANLTENIENKTTNTQIKENKNMAEFVKSEDFNKYSEYLANEIKTLKESIEAKDEAASGENTVENLTQHNNHIVESVNDLTEYVGYIAEQLDGSIQYTEHVAEKTDQSISYSESIAEKLDQGISYTEHLAESVSKVKDFANYLAEAHNEGAESNNTLLEYVEYLKENLQSVSEYAEYIAESLNETVEEVEVNVEAEEDKEEDVEAADNVEGEEVAKEAGEDNEEVTEETEEVEEVEETEEVTEEEDPAKDKDEAEDTDEIENIGDNSEEGAVAADSDEAGKEVEEIEDEEVEAGDNSEEGDVGGEEVAKEGDEDADDAVTSDSEIEDETEEADAGEGEEEAEGEDGAHDPLEAYKADISSKLDALVENATKKENENPSFFKVVSSATRNKYNELSESAKTDVRGIVSKRGFMTESEIMSVMNEAQLIVESAGAQPTFIALMPSEYKEAWANLSESKQNNIIAQSKYHTLNTEYQVANFWQTRDLRDTKVELEKVAMVTEAKKEETKPTLGYDVSGMADAFKQRFNK